MYFLLCVKTITFHLTVEKKFIKCAEKDWAKTSCTAQFSSRQRGNTDQELKMFRPSDPETRH